VLLLYIINNNCKLLTAQISFDFNINKMVKTILEQISVFIGDLLVHIPPGLLLAITPAFIESNKYLHAYRHEFFGTMIMILCTFSAGKWIGVDNRNVAWTSHAIGVIVADYICKGPNVNPAMTVTMWTMGKVSYTEAFVRICGALAGGLISFPLYHALAVTLELEPFGGPEFTIRGEYSIAEAFLSEFFATILLCFTIYIVNWELNFGKFHYIIKQTLTAIAIRALIELFPIAGPAMNPMLATSWYVFGVGTKYVYPSDFSHYFVYWVAPMLAAIFAATCYGIYNGDKIFGTTLPIGPIKKPKKKVD
jgi:glycerol uptake facilitator-like aquaporin